MEPEKTGENRENANLSEYDGKVTYMYNIYL